MAIPPLLDDKTLAALRAIDESAMQEPVTITVVTPIDDGAGSSTEATAPLTTTGLFWSVSGDEAGADQIKAQGRHRLEVPKTLVIAPNSTITVNGKSYAVKYVFPVTHYSTSLLIGLEDT